MGPSFRYLALIREIGFKYDNREPDIRLSDSTREILYYSGRHDNPHQWTSTNNNWKKRTTRDKQYLRHRKR